MDITGNNRFGLLIEDDEDFSTGTVETSPVVKKTPAAVITPKKPEAKSKKNNPNEKENKANTLNKNSADLKKKNSNALNNPYKPESSGRVNNDFKDIERKSNDRRNTKDGQVRSGAFGDFSNDNKSRTFKDRENRGPPRHRTGENMNRGKREFDRQSGSDKTGVKSIDKRDGAGAHNWGSVKQEIEDINNTPVEGNNTLTDKEEQNHEQPTDLIAPQEEEKLMTLDEWKAMRQQREKPQFNLRKAGEGEDVSQWKKMVKLNKKNTLNGNEEEFEYDPSLYPQRVGRLQRITDIQFNFNDGRRGGSNFSRGRGRGPRQFGDKIRGENERTGDGGSNPIRVPIEKVRKQRVGSNALKVDDERQFPTLG